MRKRTLLAGLAGIATVATTALPAAAIKWGEPDDGEHPYVGLMVAYTTQEIDTDNDDEPDTETLVASWRCSGTQMDEDTFLTAGHCTYGAEAVAIWYGDDLEGEMRAERDWQLFSDAMESADAYGTTVLSHPDYDDAAFYLHDVGVVELDEPVQMDTYGELPELGYWDEQPATRKKDRDSYDTVGYGLQWSMPDSNGQGRGDQDDWTKLQAEGELINNRQFGGGKANDMYVVLTNNANTGGTCSGDSGGPTFIDGSETVVAVTSFGVNTTCAGTSGIYRIDTADDLEWLGQFID